MKIQLIFVAVLLGPLLAQAADETAQESSYSKENIEFFEKDVLPILRASCFKCHGGEPKLKGGFRITSREGVLKGGELGAAVDLKMPKESQLVDAINYGGLEMPPDAKLAAEKLRR